MQVLKAELKRTQLVKEKFKTTTIKVRKECDKLKDINMATAEALEQVEGMILEDKLKACQRSKRSLIEQLSRTEENMWAIIDQYKEKLNLATTHEQRLEDEHAKASVQKMEREARERVIDSSHREAMMWMDRFSFTLNGS